MNEDLITSLIEEGFDEAAVAYALDKLKEAPDVSRPLPWCRTVAKNFVAERDRWTPCGNCTTGWVVTLDEPMTVTRCECHPRYGRENERDVA